MCTIANAYPYVQTYYDTSLSNSLPHLTDQTTYPRACMHINDETTFIRYYFEHAGKCKEKSGDYLLQGL